jgi:EamA domain-containing membrane protein RarD
VWAVNHDQTWLEAALGLLHQPADHVALAVVVLRERLRRLQLVALGFGPAPWPC